MNLPPRFRRWLRWLPAIVGVDIVETSNFVTLSRSGAKLPSKS